MDPRWAEVSLAHLKETDDYLFKRRNVGRNGQQQSGADENVYTEPKRRPKPKAKPKGAARRSGGGG